MYIMQQLGAQEYLEVKDLIRALLFSTRQHNDSLALQSIGIFRRGIFHVQVLLGSTRPTGGHSVLFVV